ncbi:ABC transporter permease [Anaerococcus sp. Marseille-P3625]|uniref:ABC transporter permease n=1 Tax=Anaerococcus sp. Marseille-P3625 TaxID=1977277 RepID=UPI000C088703|nr:ABC transporter permease [Anaerococcus sp. Marseille-P3625]
MNEIFSIVVLTLRICFISTLISTIIAILLGFTLGLNDNKFIKYVKIITNAFTSLPPVIAGVVVYLIFSKNGVLGHLSWLYTEKVIIIAQVLIVTPIITANIFPAVESIRNSFIETSLGLKISKVKMYFQLLKEVKISVISAIITGFGRAISEVGAVMIVGGNVRFKTRVLTSAIVLENNKGNYQMSIKLGIILMAISLTVSFLAMIIRGRNNDKIKKSYS